MEMRLEEAYALSSPRTQLEKGGLARQGWWARQTCHLLRQLGRGLVALGERLERTSLPEPSPQHGQ
jgi:hypothetical protein